MGGTYPSDFKKLNYSRGVGHLTSDNLSETYCSSTLSRLIISGHLVCNLQNQNQNLN